MSTEPLFASTSVIACLLAHLLTANCPLAGAQAAASSSRFARVTSPQQFKDAIDHEIAHILVEDHLVFGPNELSSTVPIAGAPIVGFKLGQSVRSITVRFVLCLQCYVPFTIVVRFLHA
jgi:hypothetical protein